ncbi:protein PPP1R35 homolog [Toxorhynchites rutilus septentrionalis]|uniref:protein PPP1R35 homolog n=1 Tax=Toxorhynchites rutilus septentrionalis TaxID=329112 RepID=UPI0024791B86|nr:protein PPP1R35 homolog [Toxorhynchites rutilus septentrionalis]
MKKCKIQKSYLRDVEIPVSISTAKVLKPTGSNVSNPIPKDKPCLKTGNPSVKTKPTNSTKFQQPELHTALNIREKIEKVKTTQTKAPTSIGELTPKSKKFVRDQITRKLNFQHDENVFKNLVPMNVNDSVLIPATKKPIRTKYVSKEKRDPEPELSDFLRPISACDIEFDPYLPPEPAPRRPNFNNLDNILDVLTKIDPGI